MFTRPGCCAAVLVLALGACEGSAKQAEQTVLAPASAPAKAPLATPGSAMSDRLVYVPAYSHIFAGGNRRIMLSITLSVRNVDPSASLRLKHVDYYDTPGHLVRRYLTSPVEIGPLSTLEYAVELFDDAGGSGANFLIGWEAKDGTQPLLAEAVMLGQTSSGSLAFVSRGVAVDKPAVSEAHSKVSGGDGGTHRDAGHPAH